jgi:D-beta-D-heptose 7-phosphate kinase / D-beta-D-heptose 1-phosphate adenosyltransferase
LELTFTNPNPTILVLGDIMIDYYLWGNCERISPEAPVQVVDIIKDSTILGGGGNVIHNLLAFGAKVDIASVIGDDDSGNDLIRMLQEVGAGVGLLVRQPHRKTSKKTRIVAANQQVVRYDIESKEPISPESEDQLRVLLEDKIKQYDVVLISDYGKGVVTPSMSQFVIGLANRHGIRVLIDPKGTDYSKYAGAYLITPNKKEAGIAARTIIKDHHSLEEAGFRLKQELQLDYAVITLSEDGIALFDTGMHLIPTRARDVFDVTGAGDTVLASLGFAIANRLNIEDACHFANYAAGVVVGKVGSATATLDEIEAYVNSFLKAGSHLYIRSSDTVGQIAGRLRQNGKKIVLVEGVFDTVGPHQVRALEAAKSHGDVLMAAVCPDQTNAKKAGGGPPVHSQEDRSYLLAALKVVDYVVLLPSDGLDEGMLKSLKPEVLILNSADREKEVADRGFFGKVLVWPEVDGAFEAPQL